MIVEVWNLDGSSKVCELGSENDLIDFFATFAEMEPFYCEFAENQLKLSVLIRRDLGVVQHSPASNDPPYMVAITPLNHDPDAEIDFVIGNEATSVRARYALPIELVKQIIIDFRKTGVRSAAVSWESI